MTPGVKEIEYLQLNGWVIYHCAIIIISSLANGEARTLKQSLTFRSDSHTMRNAEKMQDPPLPQYLYQWTANDLQSFVRYGNFGAWSRYISNVNNQTLLQQEPLERQKDLLNFSVLEELFGEDASTVFIYLQRYLRRTPIPHLSYIE